MTVWRSLPRRIAMLAALVWMEIGIALLFMLVLDTICRLAAPLTYLQPDGGHAAAIAAYPQIPWLRDYYAIYDRLSVRWHPYVYFLMSPIKSAYINVNGEGIRATWHAARAAKHTGVKPLRVFVFGGSTMFGDNARDDYTIASLLAKSLTAQSRVPAEVVNFGQEGYSNTQESLLLAEHLRRGDIPDLAIFYDGINEVATAFENHAPGLTFDELARGREFNLLNVDRRLDLSAFAVYNLARYSYAGLTAEWLADKFLSTAAYNVRTRLANARLRASGLPASETVNAQLVDGVIDTYLFNKRTVEAMARGRNFRCLFFWQPVIYEKNRLAPFEQRLVQEGERDFPGYREFFLKSYARMRELGAAQQVVDLSRVFADTDRSYYTDDAHLIEAGNQVVAEAMLPFVKTALEQLADAPARSGSGSNPALHRVQSAREGT